MKGQLSYIIKPISLVMTVVLLLLLYNTISTFSSQQSNAQNLLDITSDATNILLVLANSQDCLAYKSSTTNGLYANIVDVNRLNFFSQKYASTEPECARSFDFGWRVTVTDYKQSNNATVIGNNWSFGANEFSNAKAIHQDFSFSLPIAVRYSDQLTRPGIMQIHLVSGELESIAGILDWSCQLFKNGGLTSYSTTITTNYPLTYFPTTNQLCSISDTPACRTMWCPMSFENIGSSGQYVLKVTYSNGILNVKS